METDTQRTMRAIVALFETLGWDATKVVVAPRHAYLPDEVVQYVVEFSLFKGDLRTMMTQAFRTDLEPDNVARMIAIEVVKSVDEQRRKL